MKKKKWKPHYSGKNSTEFWDYIHHLSDEDRNEMYTLGVALQNLEELMLRLLNYKKPTK